RSNRSQEQKSPSTIATRDGYRPVPVFMPLLAAAGLPEPVPVSIPLARCESGLMPPVDSLVVSIIGVDAALLPRPNANHSPTTRTTSAATMPAAIAGFRW